MLIVALALAVIGLAALVAAVVTSNELIAWVCIGASGLGILLLIVDAIRERTSRRALTSAAALAGADTEVFEPVERTEVIEPVFEPAEVPESAEIAYAAEEFEEPVSIAVEDYPDEVVHDEPDYDTISDDEAEYPEPAEVAAVHTVSDYELAEIEADEAEEAAEGVAEAEPVAEYVELPEAEQAEAVTYTYVQDDDTATTYTYVESPDAATTYTYVEADDTGYLLIEEPREPEEAEQEEAEQPMGSENGN